MQKLTNQSNSHLCIIFWSELECKWEDFLCPCWILLMDRALCSGWELFFVYSTTIKCAFVYSTIRYDLLVPFLYCVLSALFVRHY